MKRIIWCLLAISLQIVSCNQKKIDNEAQLENRDSSKEVSIPPPVLNDRTASERTVKNLQTTEIKTPPAKDIVAWLNNKFSDRQPVYKETENISSGRGISIQEDGQYAIRSFRYVRNQSSFEVTTYLTEFHGDFKDLSLNSFKTHRSKGMIFLQFDCLEGNCVEQISYKANAQSEPENIEYRSWNNSVTVAVIPDSDMQLVKRARQAFLDLIQSTGGKTELY